MRRFKVIEVKENEYDGDSYEYVTKIDVNHYGKIVIGTSPSVLEAMKFMDEEYFVPEKEKRELILKLVKTYFPKENHTISYRTVTINITE